MLGKQDDLKSASNYKLDVINLTNPAYFTGYPSS